MQRSRRIAGFDNDRSVSQSRHESVAFGKIPLMDRSTIRELRNEEMVSRDLLLESSIAGRVCLTQWGTDYPNDPSSSVDGRCQRGRIDTARNAGHHNNVVRNELARELAGPRRTLS
jgi:hypothetical protein